MDLYVSTAINGSIFGVILAFCVILIATRNYIMALTAAATTLFILASVLATVVVCGFELGTIESICITILAGFAVDYVVHLAHAYMSSHQDGRADRVRDTLWVMGVSIASGAITSCTASIALFICTLQFFAKFGAFLCLTCAYSWLWANFFFL